MKGEKAPMEADTGVDPLVMRTNVLYCLDCGKCTGTCPVTAVKPGFSPRRLVEMTLMAKPEEIATNNYIWDCLTCGKCSNYCPTDVRFSDYIKGLRARALEQGGFSVMNHGGITYSIARAMAKGDLKQKRLEWVGGAKVKVAEKGDVLLFTGCMVYFDLIFEPLHIDGAMTVLGNAVSIMNRAGIVPAVMADEVCCGHDELWSGEEGTFAKLMEKNIQAIKRTGAKKIVTVCPECASTIKKYYKEMGGLEIEVVHISQFIDDLLKGGKIKLRQAKGKVTFQDPCRLVQHMEEVDAPRNVIAAVNPGGLVEMRDSKELASCCGTALWRNCDSFSEGMRGDRLRQAKETGADLVITACPKCQIHFSCTLSGKCEEKGIDPSLKVKDLVTYVAENME